METKIAIVDTKLNGLKDRFEGHVNDYRTLRSTFTNVTIALIALIFGISAAYVGGVQSLSSNQGTLAEQQKHLAEQQKQFGERQVEIAEQQNETNKDMKEIKIQLIKINQSMDVILKDHAANFPK